MSGRGGFLRREFLRREVLRREFLAPPSAAEPTGRTVVMGRLWHTSRPETSVEVADPAGAVAAAFAAVPQDLARLATDLHRQGLTEPAHIVEASLQIASDPSLRAMVDDLVASGTAPGAAMTRATEHFAHILDTLDDPLLAARATDVRAVGLRLAAAVSGRPGPADDVNGARILAGWEVSADDLLVNAGSVAGAVTVVGGATAHVGIVARSLGIPVLYGIDHGVLEVPNGAEVLLDTRSGRLVVEPDAPERALAEADATAAEARRARLASTRTTTLSTRDGQSVTVLANVAGVADAELATRMGAPGVGLLRTEMPFLRATAWPTVDQHLAELTPVLLPLAGRPVTIRTLDFADDKLPPFLSDRAGRLGSGLALMLAEPEAFLAQLQAILMAADACGVTVSVMVPMVDSVATLERCRGLLVSAASSVSMAVPPLGAMIETRDAVEAVEDLAKASDFLSIGTNDLTAAVLGLGRRDQTLTPARLRDPDVREAVARTVRAGHGQHGSVSVCGDAASDPGLVPDLLDLGCRTLSVAPSMMDEIRAAVRAY
jgi:phosphoenolpyruvate-protein kinase (PTS system EI component)